MEIMLRVRSIKHVGVKNNIEHWKTIVYTFGRIAQSSSLDLTKTPAINEHTIVVHLLYDELWDNDSV